MNISKINAQTYIELIDGKELTEEFWMFIGFRVYRFELSLTHFFYNFMQFSNSWLSEMFI